MALRTFDVSTPGTPAVAWAGRLREGARHPLDWRHVQRLVVVAPHPDDETLGAGGTVAWLRSRGRAVAIVAASDGEAADPTAGDGARAALAARRRVEQDAAVKALGLLPGALVRLGLADGALGLREDELAAHLEPLLDATTTVAVTWSGDGHPDHEAAARAAASAARRRGATIVEYPIWAWHWDSPSHPAMPWSRARGHLLSETERRAKRVALRAYRSQTEDCDGSPPVLPVHVLARLLQPAEIFFEAEGPR